MAMRNPITRRRVGSEDARRADETPTLSLPREMVRPAILLLLRERTAHGYALLDELDDLGVPVTDTGGLYRVLRELEESKLVRSRWEPAEAGPARRVYQLTPKGEQELRTWGEAVQRHHNIISNYLRRYRRNDGKGRRGNGDGGANHGN